MTKKTSALRRLATGTTALVLGLAGAMVMGTAASAAPVPGNINPATPGSIIIHKHVKAEENSSPGKPAGDPLAGVTFRVTEVFLDGESVPLATAEGWEAIDGLAPSDITDGDITDEGFTRGTHADVTTLAGGQVTADGLNVGLYLVEEIDAGGNLITAPAAPFLVTIPMPVKAVGDVAGGWNYNVDVYPKNELGSVTPTKTVGTFANPADVQLGAIVPFTISAPVAQPPLPYTSFSITDGLSAGLEFDSWGAISIGGVPLVAADYIISADNTTVTLTSGGIGKLNAAASVVGGTTVTAIINAKVNDLGQLENEATVTLNGTPGDTPVVTTNWARLDITKQDSATNAPLVGATFELYSNANPRVLLATGTTGTDGKLSFIVWVGNGNDIIEVVWLKETIAPQGYVLPADPWTDPITLTAGTTAETSIKAHTIKNLKAEGPELPLTGAQGTLAMTIGGLLLVTAGGGALLVARRRKMDA